MLASISNNRAISAGTPVSCPRDSLLDKTAAQIGVDQPMLGPLYCLAQSLVRYFFVPGKSREPLRLGDLHRAA